MHEIKLDDRLQSLTKFITPGGILLDVGTDHGFLPIYLIQNNLCMKVIASDINIGPLNNAHKNILKYNTPNIDLILSDGLKNIIPGSFTDIIIAGMGAHTIINILIESKWILNSQYNFIFQPMSNVEILREFLYNNGFNIIKEDLSKDNDKLYVILHCKYTNNIIKTDFFRFYIGEILNSESPFVKLYLQKQIKKLEIKYNGLLCLKNSDNIEFYLNALNKIREIHETLNT